ncbi:MAG: hypothetical protein K8U03_12725 [Planctomycetia bacterium]|nr:hypothetical protein [Planctomycetia bacterium]
MNRIFYPLALLGAVALSSVMVLGLYLHSYDIRNPRDIEAQRLATVHRLSGIAAGVLVLLVESVVVTYFVGTNRWCKEVSETYRLGDRFVSESTRLKRKAFPISFVGMLIVVGIAALGGAADPGSSLSRDLLLRFGGDVAWADFHLLASLLGITLIVGGFFLQSNYIRSNHAVIEGVMAEVKRIRSERGLD